jgi:ABC-type transport system involved in cytochrome c biogenesis permease subunit
VNEVLFDVALTAYILAAAASIGSLLGRRDQLGWIALLLIQAGWACHTVAVILRGVELRRLPFMTIPEVISLVIWAVVLFDLWAERRDRVRALSAFVLPVVLVLGLALILIGLAALVVNFGGAIMYLLQERQLKAKRAGTVYHRLPALETLDRLTVATLTAGFPFLTVGLLLGVLAARRAWGSLLPSDPLALFSLLMWVVYAVILVGRAMGHWRGRRAAYFSIAGFCVLLATLSAGAFLSGRHGL